MKTFFAVCLALVLSACGGGGGSGGDGPPPMTPPPTTPTATGIWEGTASTGASVSLAILEDGQTWGVYTSGNLITGALYGNTVSSGTSLAGSGKDFNIAGRFVEVATYTGTFVATSRINLTTSNGQSLVANYSTDYDQPALLTSLAGTYAGGGVTGNTDPQAIAVSISAAGLITVPTSQGCGATGIASPRASGKNIFDVSVTFNGTTCALGNGANTKGIAYLNTATRQLLVLALNSTKTDGFIYVGKK